MKNPEHFSAQIILPVTLLSLLLLSPVAYSSQPTSIWSRSHLFGDWGGVRPWLARQGVDISAVEQPVPSDVLSGGARQGKAFAGLLTLSARIHLGRYVDVPGLPSNSAVTASLSEDVSMDTSNEPRLCSASYLSWRQICPLRKNLLVCGTPALLWATEVSRLKPFTISGIGLLLTVENEPPLRDPSPTFDQYFVEKQARAYKRL